MNISMNIKKFVSSIFIGTALIIGSPKASLNDTTYSVTLYWIPNSEPDIWKYDIYEGEEYAISLPHNKCDFKNNICRTNMYLPPGLYAFRVKAVDEAKQESPFSDPYYLQLGVANSVDYLKNNYISESVNAFAVYKGNSISISKNPNTSADPSIVTIDDEVNYSKGIFGNEKSALIISGTVDNQNENIRIKLYEIIKDDEIKERGEKVTYQIIPRSDGTFYHVFDVSADALRHKNPAFIQENIDRVELVLESYGDATNINIQKLEIYNNIINVGEFQSVQNSSVSVMSETDQYPLSKISWKYNRRTSRNGTAGMKQTVRDLDPEQIYKVTLNSNLTADEKSHIKEIQILFNHPDNVGTLQIIKPEELNKGLNTFEIPDIPGFESVTINVKTDVVRTTVPLGEYSLVVQKQTNQ